MKLSGNTAPLCLKYYFFLNTVSASDSLYKFCRQVALIFSTLYVKLCWEFAFKILSSKSE